MAIIAKWLNKTWEVSPKKIFQLDGLTTSYALLADSNDDAEGKPSSNIRGLDLQPLTFDTFLSDAVGVDVRAEIESWGSLVGESGAFVLAGRRFGPAKFQLTKVKATEVIVDDLGRFRQAKLNLAFQEDAPEASSNKSNNNNASAKLPALGVASSATYKELGISGSAANIGASTADKSAKKPNNAQLTM